MKRKTRCLHFCLITMLCTVFTGSSRAHGYITFPPGRAYLCQQFKNLDCGSVQYEPQSIEGPKGYPKAGPRDTHIASADKPEFMLLDQQSPARWYKTNVTAGNISFVWKLTAQHKTAQWRYYLTKKGWNNSTPLRRSAFEAVPFCQYNSHGAVPGVNVTHKCVLPQGHPGYQIVLAIWDIADTRNAFYQIIDLNVH